MTGRRARRFDSSRPISVVAFIASVLSVMLPPFGVLGLGLGIVAKRHARESPGHRHRLADAAIALGSVTSLLTLGLLAWLIPYSAQTIAIVPREAPRASRVTGPGRLSTTSPLDERWASLASQPNPEAGIEEQVIGKVILVDVGPRVPTSLTDALNEQRELARDANRTVLLWVVMPDCNPCDDFRAALEADRLQTALATVRLVRLNVLDFVVELTHLGVPVDVFPGFVLLDDHAEAVDYIHGGEWNADVADNIAPVLESFIDGTYTHRRHPWRGGPHDDETPI